MSDRLPYCNDPDAEDLSFDESSLGSCNYCTLQSLRRYEKGDVSIQLRAKANWIEVYLVTRDKYDAFISEKWKASFLGLTTKCAC